MGRGIKREVSSRGQAGDPIEGKLTVADEGPPVEQAVGDSDAIVTGGAHGRYPMGAAGGHIQAGRATLGAIKDGIDGAGGAGTCPAGGFKLSQFGAGQGIEFSTGVIVDLSAKTIKAVLPEDELLIIVIVFPEETAVLGGHRQQFFDLRTGEIQGLIGAFRKGSGPPVRPPVLPVQIFSD